ncbi:MAG TPA: Na+/H+ antiporter NhaA [Vicinamibacterales bacterium]|nr:Na+/H+ antiporter NhaA [Vicinamibacterales bacterium]
MKTHALAHPALATHRSGRSAATLLRFGLEHHLWLPLGGIIGFVWANTSPAAYFTFAQRLSFPVNEIGMALFFALITQEIVEEMMPHGALHSWRRWVLPLVAAAGAAAGSTLVYLAYVSLKQEPILMQGWLVAGAFDIAFAYFIVKSIFTRHPAVSFLLVMAIATNTVGMIMVALRYQPVEIRPGGTALMLAALALAYTLRRFKVDRFWPYLFLCGPLSWWALYLDGFHPALALVPIVPFLPHVPRGVDTFEDTPDAPSSSPRHFEHEWNYAVQAVLFLFGLVNAGVLLQRYGTGTWALLSAALVGRPMGIVAAVGIAVWLGMRLPPRLHWRDLVVVALAASSGFTFALFAAVALYPVGPILAELKLGALLSGVGVIAAFAAARILNVGRFALVAMLVVIPSIAAAQIRATVDDDTIRALIEEQFADDKIAGVTVSVSEGAVTLRGVVDTLWAREKAIDEARDIRQVRSVVSDIVIAPAESDAQIAEDVSTRIRRYVFYSIFDDASVMVDKGVVTLTGRATMPHKADAFVDLASRVKGVQRINNLVQALPVSSFDDELRFKIARQIYGDPIFWNLAFQVDPPLHIVVEHGRVTLTGVVPSEVERRKAEMIALSTFGVFGVENKLTLDEE